MSRILDLTQLDGPSVQEWMGTDGGYTGVRVPPGVVLTMDQFREWLRLRDTGPGAAGSYARAIARLSSTLPNATSNDPSTAT